MISDLKKSIEKTCSDYYKFDKDADSRIITPVTDVVRRDSLEETLDYLIWDWNDLIEDVRQKELSISQKK